MISGKQRQIQIIFLLLLCTVQVVLALGEPGLRECGLSCSHAAGDSSVSRICFTVSLKPLLTPSVPQSGVDCTYDSDRLGVQMMQDRALTLSPLKMSKSYRQQTSKFAHLLMYY